MPASTRDAFSSLEALSPVDGRYRAATAPLRELLSEAGLIGERVRIESRWLLHLSVSVPQLAAAALAPAVLARAQQLAGEPDADADGAPDAEADGAAEPDAAADPLGAALPVPNSCCQQSG